MNQNLTALRQQMSGALSDVGSASSLAGGVLQGVGVQEGNIGAGALGGALTGMAGGPIGMIVGALGGAISAGQSGTAQAEERSVMERDTITMSRMPLGAFGEGGGSGTDIPVSVQTEKGEVILLENGMLVDSAAKGLHEEMDPNEITETLLPGEVVFSNDPSMRFNLERFAKATFGTAARPWVKKETDKPAKVQRTSLQDVKGVGDVDKEVTPAEVAKLLRRVYKTRYAPDAKYQDIFSRSTDKSNVAQRSFHLARLVMQQELMKDENFTQSDINDMINPKEQEVMIARYGRVVPGLGMASMNQSDRRLNLVPQVDPIVGAPSPIPVQSTFGPIQQRFAKSAAATGPKMLPQRPIAPVKSMGSPAPASVAGSSPGATTANPMMDALDSYDEDLNMLEQSNAMQLDADLKESDQLFQNRRLARAGAFGAGVGFLGAQTAYEQPFLYRTGAESVRFPRISEAEVQASVSAARQGSAALIDRLEAQGASPAMQASTMAALRASELNAEGAARMEALRFNRTQQANAFEDFNRKRNANLQSIANAENRTIQNQNARFGQLGVQTQNYLAGVASDRASQVDYNRSAEKQFNDNMMRLMGARGDSQAVRMNTELLQNQANELDAANTRRAQEIAAATRNPTASLISQNAYVPQYVPSVSGAAPVNPTAVQGGAEAFRPEGEGHDDEGSFYVAPEVVPNVVGSLSGASTGIVGLTDGSIDNQSLGQSNASPLTVPVWPYANTSNFRGFSPMNPGMTPGPDQLLRSGKHSASVPLRDTMPIQGAKKAVPRAGATPSLQSGNVYMNEFKRHMKALANYQISGF